MSAQTVRVPKRWTTEEYISLLVDHLRPQLQATRKLSDNDLLRARLIKDIRRQLERTEVTK